jgi:hypothetical protein
MSSPFSTCGIDIMTVWVCRCGCPKLRITAHSVRSKIVILRCPWCGKRRGHPAAEDLKKIEAFIKRHGWQSRSLVLADNGDVYVR